MPPSSGIPSTFDSLSRHLAAEWISHHIIRWGNWTFQPYCKHLLLLPAFKERQSALTSSHKSHTNGCVYQPRAVSRTKSLSLALVWFMDLDSVSVHEHAKKKKNLANIQPPWPHAWSITRRSQYRWRARNCCQLPKNFFRAKKSVVFSKSFTNSN